MNCPECQRPLAQGARTCVYCGQGSTFKRRETIGIPEGTLPKHRRTFRWGRWLLILLVVGGGLAAWFYPPFRDIVRTLLEKAKAFT